MKMNVRSLLKMVGSVIRERSDKMNAVEAMQVIEDAIENKKTVHIRYEIPREDGSRVVSDREIAPSHHWTINEGIVYVKAYCYMRNDMRTFRLDRITSVEKGRQLKANKPVVYPATWELRHARAVSVTSPEKFVATGNWSETPVPLYEPAEQAVAA